MFIIWCSIAIIYRLTVTVLSKEMWRVIRSKSKGEELVWGNISSTSSCQSRVHIAPVVMSVWTIQEAARKARAVSGGCPGSRAVTLSRVQTGRRTDRHPAQQTQDRWDFWNLFVRTDKIVLGIIAHFKQGEGTCMNFGSCYMHICAHVLACCYCNTKTGHEADKTVTTGKS